ncbi:AP-3 complex subunit delta-1-like [Macrosteles quadrilineatus]|uniref:AP-3 complex subunit delta-1-like n=1 Tax=Macrosteles quadrilineatus TaxID=74068 RepID=UPI0023E2E9EF|nr:AP-3 complex subunit delta-1-like [Macrosteles quadrilineatus]
MALKKVRGTMERMFDKNLTDLVRGIRNNKDNEAKYIAQCIEEIKQELRQDNLAVKATAVAKLTYLQMLGYDMSWAGFNIIEVMSSSKFTYKRIGYLASSQCFHADTELLMLTTNMIRKDLNSQNQYDAGLALSALSCFISPDLARDLANDIMTLLTSTKPYLRKKAVLMMYKVFLRFPEALRPAFPRLKEKLEDPDSGVQSAAVNVVCELARKNPKNYLSLAPVFFKLMTTSTNNWMLIKIIKLFGALTPLEPRLGKKLIEPLTNLIHSTSAMSLLYECINTVIAVLISISSGMPNHSASIQLCVQKLRILIEDSDQNLKYLGLLAMSKILKSHPKSVQSHKDLVMQCLDDKDESIRLRALDLLYGMVSKKTLVEIVKKLMVHMDKAEGTTYRDELLSKIIDICSQNNYQYITNFEWYVSVLVELTRMEGTQHGPLVATQMLDVAIRVQAIRGYAVRHMALLLENTHLLTQPGSKMADVLYAAAWIAGEFATELTDPEATLQAMLSGRVNALPGHIQAFYVQNILKVFSVILGQSDVEKAIKECDLVIEGLLQYVSSADLEVQERASSAVQLLQVVRSRLQDEGDVEQVAADIAALFSGELNPVAPKAQKKVQIPEGLDLDAWINEPPPPSSESEEEEEAEATNPVADIFIKTSETKSNPEPTEEQLKKMREARKVEQSMNPHYLKMTDSVSNIPVAPIDLQVPLKITSGLTYQNKRTQKKSKKRKKKKSTGQVEDHSSDEETVEPIPVEVNRGVGEMPEGAQDSDGGDSDARDHDDPHRALDINLDEPLREEERLPVLEHRFTNTPNPPKSRQSKKKEKEVPSMLLFNDEYQEVPSEYQEVPSTSSHKTKKTKSKKSVEKSEKPKKQKHSSSKTKKDKKRHRGEDELVKLKEGYEEALGISTPSKEIFCIPDKPVISRLACNKVLTVDYEVRAQDDRPDIGPYVCVGLSLANHSSASMRDFEITLSHSKDIKFVQQNGQDEMSRKLRVQVNGNSSEVAQLLVEVADTTRPHKVRGTLTYIHQVQDGSAVQDKVDFWLQVGVTAFLRDTKISQDAFSSLLSEGQLTHQSSITLRPVVARDFPQMVSLVSSKCRLTVVEQVDQAASLFTTSLSGHQVCLLVKSDPQQLTVQAKSSSESLAQSLLIEIQTILST